MHYHNALAGKSAKKGAEELKPFIKGENGDRTKLPSRYPNSIKLRINVCSFAGATLRILNVCSRLFLKRFFQRMQMASCAACFTAKWHGDVQTTLRDSNSYGSKASE